MRLSFLLALSSLNSLHQWWWWESFREDWAGRLCQAVFTSSLAICSGQKEWVKCLEATTFCCCLWLLGLYIFLSPTCKVLRGLRPVFSFLCGSCPGWHNTRPTIGPSMDICLTWIPLSYPRYSLDFFFPHFISISSLKGAEDPSFLEEQLQGPFTITQFNFILPILQIQTSKDSDIFKDPVGMGSGEWFYYILKTTSWK